MSGAPSRFRALLVMRRSPDWRSLAADHRAKVAIDPNRFLPDPSAPGFPANLSELIDIWNHTFAIDYFTCRAVLKEIAGRNLDLVTGATRREIATFQAGELDLSRYIVFFHDDDDWFAPDMALAVSEIPPSAFDVCVFPLVRLWTDTVTFVRAATGAPAIVGRPSAFGYRYHSNNYGVVGGRLDDETACEMREHMPASTYAERRGFTDFYVNRTLGVTAKTPCSASQLNELRRRKADPHAYVRRYVESIEGLVIPEPLSWLRAGVRDIAELFARAVSSM